MLVCRLWHATQLTTGNLVVLHLNLGNNIGRYQVIFFEFLRVQPDTHGVLGTKELYATNARGTA